MFRQPVILIGLLFTGVWLSEARAQQSRGDNLSATDCDTLCANLHIAIQRHPDRLSMWLEDALVIQEACVRQIVETALDAVSNEPERVSTILRTAVLTAPAREQEIRAAIERFLIPAAVAYVGEAEEVRRALVPDKVEATPIEEVRRAVIVKKE